MEDDIDLSGIHPSRHPEARRRIALIEEYWAQSRRDQATVDAFAERMGKSDTQFARLARAWRMHRNPTLLGVTDERTYEREGRQIPDATRQAIDDAIAAIGPRASFASVRMEAERLFRERGVASASAGTIHAALTNSRDCAPKPSAEPNILLGSVFVRMPVITARLTLTAPELVLAVRIPEGQIIAHTLVLDDDRPKAMLPLLDLILTSQSLPVVTDKHVAAVMTKGEDDRPDGPRVVSLNRGGILADWIGNRIGDLGIRHRPRRIPAADATPPVPTGHARLLVAAAIRQHNAGLADKATSWTN